jgi:hypothetical protein
MGGVGSMGGEVCGVSYEARGVRTRRPGRQCTMQAHAHAHEGSRLGCEARCTRAGRPSGVGEAYDRTQGDVGARAARRSGRAGGSGP